MASDECQRKVLRGREGESGRGREGEGDGERAGGRERERKNRSVVKLLGLRSLLKGPKASLTPQGCMVNTHRGLWGGGGGGGILIYRDDAPLCADGYF